MKAEKEKRMQYRSRYRTKNQTKRRGKDLLKRGFSLFLCLVMCLTMLPELGFTAKADDRFIATLDFFVMSEEDGHFYDTLDITVETTDGSYYERQNCDDYKTIARGSNAFFDVPILEGKEGSTIVTAYVQARKSNDRFKAVKMALTKDMLVQNGDHYDVKISVKKREENNQTGIIKLGGMSTLNDDLVVTDEAGNQVTATYWITDQTDTAISDGHRYDNTDHSVKEICLEFPDELKAGQKLHIHNEWNNNLWDADVTLDANKSAVLNGYDDINWFVRPDIGVWCDTHEGEEGYGNGEYGKYTYLGLCYRNGSLVEDSLRLMRPGDATYRRPSIKENGSYTVLILLASAYAVVGTEHFNTLEEAKNSLAALAAESNQEAADLYAEESFEAKLVSKKDVYLGNEKVSNMWITCDIPKGTISPSMMFYDGELVLPESTGGALLAGHEYAVNFYTKSVITDAVGNAVMRLNYNNGKTEEKEIVYDNTFGYDVYRESDGRLKQEFCKKGAFPQVGTMTFQVVLPDDAVTVESIQVQFGNIDYKVPVNREVKPYIGISFDGSSLPRHDKMLTIENAAGKIIESKNLGREAIADSLYIETNALENGEYTIRVSGKENGKNFEYGSTKVTVADNLPAKATVFLTAVDPADIMPVVKNANGETGIQYALNWYEDAEGTKYIGSESHLMIDTSETVYVKAIPMGQDVINYLPTALLPVTASDEGMPVVLPDSPKVTVSGKVSVENEKMSPEGLTVIVNTTLKGYSVNQTAETAKDGSFTLENVTFFDEEEGQTMLMVSDPNIEKLTTTLKSNETENLNLTVKMRQGIIQTENVENISLTNAAGEAIPFMKSGNRLYLHDPNMVSENETLTLSSVYTDKRGSAKVKLDAEKSGVAEAFTWSYRSRVHVRFDNPYRQSVVMLLYRDGELVAKRDNDSSLTGSGKTPEYWGDYLDTGSYTYVFVNRGTYQMLTDDAITQYDKALESFDALGKKQYVILQHEVSATLTGSETKEVALSMPMGVPPMSEINEEASQVAVEVGDETIDVRITVSPLDTTDRKFAVINVYTDQKANGSGKVLNDPNVIKGSLYINGHRISEDELERGFSTYVENVTMQKDVFERQTIHGDAGSFDGFYQFAVKDVTKYGGWPLTLRYTSGRTDVEKVNVTATVSFSQDNKNQRRVGSFEEITPALTLDAQEQIGTNWVYCAGMGPKDSEVTIYVDGVASTVVKTSRQSGYYCANVKLPNAYGRQTYELEASAQIDGNTYYSDPCEVNYNSVYPYIDDYGYVSIAWQSGTNDFGSRVSMQSYWKTEVSYLYYWPPVLKDVGIIFRNLGAYSDKSKAVYDVKLCIPLNDKVIEIPAHYRGDWTDAKATGTAGLWVIDPYPLGYTAPNNMYITYKVGKPDYDIKKTDRDSVLQDIGNDLLDWNGFFADNKMQLRNLWPFNGNKDFTLDIDRFYATNWESTTYTGKAAYRVDNIIGTVTMEDGSEAEVNESFVMTEEAGKTYDGKTAQELISEWKEITKPLVAYEKEEVEKLIEEGKEIFSEDDIAFLEDYKEDIQQTYRCIGDAEKGTFYSEDFEWYTVEGGDEIWLYTKMDMDTYTCVLCESKYGAVFVDTYKRVFEKGKEASPDFDDEEYSVCEQVMLRWYYVFEALNNKMDVITRTKAEAEKSYDSDGQSSVSASEAESGLIGKLYYGGGSPQSLPRKGSWGESLGQNNHSSYLSIGSDLQQIKIRNGISSLDADNICEQYNQGYTTNGGVGLDHDAHEWGGDCIKEVANITKTSTSGAKGGAEGVIKTVAKSEAKKGFQGWVAGMFGGERRDARTRKAIMNVYQKLKQKEMNGQQVDWTNFPHTQETQDDYLNYWKDKSKKARKDAGRDRTFRRKTNTRVAVDPSGYIYAGVKSNRISDVTAKIYEVDDSGNRTLWNATEFAQNNPYISDEKGVYQWMVPTGKWSVTFEKAGYQTYTTGESDGYGADKAGDTWYMPVFPEQLDVNINLQALEAPKVVSCEADKTTREVFVVFDQYMDIETLSADRFTLVENTINKLSVEEVTYPDAEENDGKTYARTVRLILPEEVDGSNTVLRIERAVTSYTGQTMDSAYVSEKLEPVRIDRTATPVMSVKDGELETNTIITLTCDTPGAKIFYTVDGSEPTTASKLYTEEIAMTGTMNVKAIAIAPGRDASEVATAAYSIAKAEQPIIPQFTLGDVNDDEEVNIADALMISRYDAGLAELDETALLAGDVNGDDEVNIADALMISRYDAGLITEFNTGN